MISVRQLIDAASTSNDSQTGGCPQQQANHICCAGEIHCQKSYFDVTSKPSHQLSGCCQRFLNSFWSQRTHSADTE